MKNVGLWFARRGPRNGIDHAASVGRNLPATIFALALLIAATTSAFAILILGRPTGLPPISVSVSPDPVLVNEPVTVTVTNAFPAPGTDPIAIVDGARISLTKTADGTWTGSFIPKTAGIKAVSATDGAQSALCSSTGASIHITFVKAPNKSGWKMSSPDRNRNYAALKSPKRDDVVTYGLHITPDLPWLTKMARWSGAKPSSDNMTATVDASRVEKRIVSATLLHRDAAAFTNWIFWGSITYNTQYAFAQEEGLSFAEVNGHEHDGDENLPAEANPTSAGSYYGDATLTHITRLNVVHYDPILIAATKVEVIGALTPTGIGNIIGNVCTFYPQKATLTSWNTELTGLEPAGNATGKHEGQHDDGPHQWCEQTTPVNDLIFMIDDPRVYAPNYNTAKGYIGQALNAINYIYMINGTKASDPGYWSSNIRVQLQAGLERHGNIVEHGIVTPISMSACSGSTPALGNPPLPTTWSGGTTSDNGAW